MARQKYLHTVRVEVPDGERALTRVLLDDKELRGVTRVRFDTGGVNDFDGEKAPTVTISLIAEVVFEGKLPVDLIREYMDAS